MASPLKAAWATARDDALPLEIPTALIPALIPQPGRAESQLVDVVSDLGEGVGAVGVRLDLSSRALHLARARYDALGVRASTMVLLEVIAPGILRIADAKPLPPGKPLASGKPREDNVKKREKTTEDAATDAVAAAADADEDEEDKDARALVGRSLIKRFGGEPFRGVVTAYDADAKFFQVKYEDGDEEELERRELTPLVSEAAEKEKKAGAGRGGSTKRGEGVTLPGTPLSSPPPGFTKCAKCKTQRNAAKYCFAKGHRRGVSGDGATAEKAAAAAGGGAATKRGKKRGSPSAPGTPPRRRPRRTSAPRSWDEKSSKRSTAKTTTAKSSRSTRAKGFTSSDSKTATRRRWTVGSSRTSSSARLGLGRPV